MFSDVFFLSGWLCLRLQCLLERLLLSKDEHSRGISQKALRDEHHMVFWSGTCCAHLSKAEQIQSLSAPAVPAGSAAAEQG